MESYAGAVEIFTPEPRQLTLKPLRLTLELCMHHRPVEAQPGATEKLNLKPGKLSLQPGRIFGAMEPHIVPCEKCTRAGSKLRYTLHNYG